jgi:hypothetical protein
MVRKFYVAIFKLGEHIKDESVDRGDNMKLAVRK